MASKSGGIRAGKAFIELLVSDAGLRKGLSAASAQLKTWGAAVSSIGLKAITAGAAIVAPLAAASQVFSSMGDDLAKASARTGIAVENLSELAYAASQSGSSLEGLEGGVRKMQKFLLTAAKGGDDAVETLERLGLTVDDLSKLSPDKQFKALADRLAMITDPTLRAATAMEVFGKAGTSLLPLIQDGAAGIEELEAQGRRLGQTWSTKDAKAAEEFGDRVDDLWKVMKRLTSEVGSAVAPTLREFVLIVTRGAVNAMKWVKEHKQIVVTALKVGAGVVAAGLGMLVLGKAIAFVGTIVGGVSAALGILGSVLTGIVALLNGALFGGIGVVVAALGGLGAWLFYTSDAGSKALTFLGDMFRTLKTIAGETLTGIIDALRAGDWQLAAEILWLGIKTAFTAGTNIVKGVWRSFVNFLLESWVIAMAAIDISIVKTTTAFAAMLLGINKGLDPKVMVKSIADAFTGGLGAGIQGVANVLEDVMTEEERDELRRLEQLEKQRLDAVDAETKAKLDGLGKVDEASRAAHDADLKRLEELTAKLKQKTDAAAGAAAAATTVPPVAPKVPTPADLADTLDDVAKRNVGTRGTLSGHSVALQGLQGGPLADIATATKETAKNTKKMVQGGRLHGTFR